MRSNKVNMFIEVAKKSELAKGGMKAFEVNGKEIILCNFDGKIYALDRRCGHMNAPLDKGTLEGYILTCPMHDAQFDITTGKTLSGPVPEYFDEPLSKKISHFFNYIGLLMNDIKTHDIRAYPVKVEGESIKVNVN